MRAVEAVQDFGRARGMPAKDVFGLALALEECGTNIVNYAYQRDATQTFGVTIEEVNGGLAVELRDRGPAFDPTTAQEREPDTDNDDRPPGGWGLPLVRRFVDEVRYAREDRENVLRITKRCGIPRVRLDAARLTISAMPLEIHIQQDCFAQNASAVSVKLVGSLDTATAPELEQQLKPLLAGPVKDMVFDLAQLKFVSSAGLRVFSITRRQLKDRGGRAVFVNLQPQIKEVFEIIWSLPGVAVFQTMEELDAYLIERQKAHENKPATS
ncbi:MAG: anti-sigma factor antagonist [Verrucomicrobia bacterium]|nr:anti-sigma factor antagonist [Verrucomicrobiota bacterium]